MASSSELQTGTRGLAIDVSSADATGLSGVRALYIGVSGDVKVDLIDGGTALIFKSHPIGYLMAQPSKIYTAGTTATNIVALY